MNIGDKVVIDLSGVTPDDYYKDIFYNCEMFKYNNKKTTIKKTLSDNKFRINADKGKFTWGKDVLKADSKKADEEGLIEKFTELNNNIDKLVKNINNRTLYDDSMQELVVNKVKNISVDELTDKIEKKLDTYIRKTYGNLPKTTIEVNNGECIREVKGKFHNKFEQILKMVKANVPVMLTGPAGCGKNHTLEQVAEALGLDFYFSNAVTQEFTLKGFIDANGKYQATQFYNAFTKGGLFFLDEADACVAEALLILNSAIANGYFDFPTGREYANENFRIVCAGNTYGTGADMVYVGRNVLDGATLDRFAVIDFDYDKDIEEQLAYDKDIYDFIVALRESVNKNQLRYIISMRATINSAKLLDMGISEKDVLISTIIKSMKTDDLNIIINDIKCSNKWYNLLKEVVDERN